MSIGVVGLGNLGKSLVEAAKCDREIQLVGAFSRRNVEGALPLSELQNYSSQIDVQLLALGSFRDISENLYKFQNFHTVDSFDTHSGIASYKRLAQKVKPNTISICCVGWDPGILSIVRGGLSCGIDNVCTFWGRGISQGHSNALRSVRGVIDAVEITQPNPTAVAKCKRGEKVLPEHTHRRLCYVACNETDLPRIATEICRIPNYFLGQDVVVKFCSAEEIAKLKADTRHSGQIVATDGSANAHLTLNLQSNVGLTAKIMLAYAKAVPKLAKDGFCGPLDPFDVPLRYVADKKLI